MFNIVARWLWNRQDAFEVVQEAFMKLWEHRARVAPATARAYTYRTALNLAKNRKRYRALWKVVGLEAATQAVDGDQFAQLESSADQTRVRLAITVLPDKLRQVILLRHFAEMDYEAIALTLAISPGTVASRMNRGMSRLRAELGDLADAFA